ncbi:MAG: hypothetical protein II781_00040 [Clostridia bacterium]|nr:hypothetical protein [Clostridia bacterium]
MQNNQRNVRFCIFCGSMNDGAQQKCAHCGKPLYPADHQVRRYLVREFKDQLKSKVTDSIFNRIRDFLLSNLFGLLLSLAVVFTAVSAISAALPSVPKDAAPVRNAPIANALGILLNEEGLPVITPSPTPLPTPVPTPTPEPTPDYSHLVTDGFYETIEIKSSTSNPYKYTYSIPTVNLDSEEIRQLNQKLYDTYYAYYADTDGRLAPINYDYTNKYVEVACAGIHYRWTVCNDVLSLIVSRTMYPDATERTEIEVYLVDILAEKQITQDELLAKIGMSEDEAYKLAAEALGCSYCESYKMAIENRFASESEILKQFRRTVDPENARAIQLYLDENGDLCGVGYCYSLAGASRYLHTVNLSHHDIPDLYLKYLNK